MYRCLKCFLIVCLPLSGCQPPKPAPPKPIDELQLAQTDIQHIATPRPSGTAANQQVATYLSTELCKAGYRVHRQTFQQGSNVIGVRRGTSTRTMIIGSHYDSVLCPGADDNGSGCAVNLLVARALAKRPLSHTIVIVFFDAEERGLLGSRHYATHMTEPCDLMINLDMVGHLRTARAPPLEIIDVLSRKYAWARSITFRNTGPSDHTPFELQGISTLWIFTGSHSHYHQQSDAPSTLNLPGMVQIGHYVRDIVLTFDKAADIAFVNSLSSAPYRP